MLSYRIIYLFLFVSAIFLVSFSYDEAASTGKNTGGRKQIPAGLEPPSEDVVRLDESSEEPEGEKPYHIPVILNHSVENHLEYFKTRGRDEFQLWLDRSQRYIPLMKRILKEKNLPEDLVYVAMIESGFNPYAVSWAKAVGPWQFMPTTAKSYGLTINWWLDERKDPIKATHAAADHLKDLYHLFNSWPLALASYNAGAGKVQRAVLRTRGEDFWDLRASRLIRRETKNYVPKYMAATIIAKNPMAYGFSVAEVEPFAFDAVTIEGSVDLRLIARCAECTYREIKELNPELKRWITPPHTDRYVVRIPKGKREAFLTNFASVPAEQMIQWERHRVRRKETIASIAKRYNSSSEAIRTINRLKGNRIRRGRHILVPLDINGREEDLSYLTAEAQIEKQRILYRVKRGETLWKIARAHNVSVSDLRAWNRGRIGRYLRIGQKLRLFVYVDQI